MTAEFHEPRSAIVTGGARRIGAGLCRHLARDGWHLLIHCFHSRTEAEELADELGNSRLVAADLSDPGAAATITAALGGMPPARLLINNAAQFSFDSVDSFTLDSWDSHQAANLRAPALLSRAFADQLPAGEGGLIVNMLDS